MKVASLNLGNSFKRAKGDPDSLPDIATILKQGEMFMAHWGRILGLLPLVALGACATQPSLQAIDVRAVSSVQAEIKRQVGIYMIAARQNPRPVAFANMLSDKYQSLFWCGVGAIGFDISTIKAELTTSLDRTDGGTVGIKTPVVTIGGGLKTEGVNSQTLDYNLWPLPLVDQPEEFKKQTVDIAAVNDAPIAQVLLALRDALILSAMKDDYSKAPAQPRAAQPCFKDFNPDKPGADAGNSFKIALSFTTDASGSIGITLATPISPSFSLSGESKATTGNSISVSFIQQGVLVLQTKKDAAEKLCAAPVKDPRACERAKREYEDEKSKQIGVNILLK